MAGGKFTIPAGETVQVLAPTLNDVIIANDGSNQVGLNTTDPQVDGSVITLSPNDSVAMSAGSKWANSDWFAWSPSGSVVVTTSAA